MAKKKEAKKIYHMTMNEAQLRVVKSALEDYFRTRMGQFWDFTDEVALAGWTYNKDDPENSRKFDDFLHRRDAAKMVFETGFKIAQPWQCDKTREMLIAEDIWSVIRHQFYMERPEPKDHYTTDSSVYLWSGEPCVKLEMEEVWLTNTTN